MQSIWGGRKSGGPEISGPRGKISRNFSPRGGKFWPGKCRNLEAEMSKSGGRKSGWGWESGRSWESGWDRKNVAGRHFVSAGFGVLSEHVVARSCDRVLVSTTDRTCTLWCARVTQLFFRFPPTPNFCHISTTFSAKSSGRAESVATRLFFHLRAICAQLAKSLKKSEKMLFRGYLREN